MLWDLVASKYPDQVWKDYVRLFRTLSSTWRIIIILLITQSSGWHPSGYSMLIIIKGSWRLYPNTLGVAILLKSIIKCISKIIFCNENQFSLEDLSYKMITNTDCEPLVVYSCNVLGIAILDGLIYTSVKTNKLRPCPTGNVGEQLQLWLNNKHLSAGKGLRIKNITAWQRMVWYKVYFQTTPCKNMLLFHNWGCILWARWWTTITK